MNKSEMVAAIAKKAGLPQKHTEKVIDSLIEIIAKTLKKGDKLTLSRFGTFKVVVRKARTGRNPRTGAAIRIARKKVPKFVVSKKIWIPPHKK